MRECKFEYARKDGEMIIFKVNKNILITTKHLFEFRFAYIPKFFTIYFCINLNVLVIDTEGQWKWDISRQRLSSKQHPSHHGECVTLS